MSFKQMIGAAVLVFSCNPLMAGPKTVTLTPGRTIEIIDQIGPESFEVAQQIDKATMKDHSPLYLMINSPGGMIIVGGSIVDSITVAKARGVRVICAVGTLAASMAFNILAKCDERYALPNTKLLFHPARIVSRNPLTSQMLKEAAADLDLFEIRSQKELIEAMGVSREFFDYHHNRETMWEATELAKAAPGFLTIVQEIKGTDKQFVLEKPRNPLDFLFGLKDYSLIYIAPVFNY